MQLELTPEHRPKAGMRAAKMVSYLFGFALLSAPVYSWSFSKTNMPGTSGKLTVEGVGAGVFDPALLQNWVRDVRAPLIAPKAGGSCPANIYNANAVINGGAVNVFFGGWDGVSSCHDSISVVVTEDDFKTFGEHVPVIATGDRMHVNNPSALKRPDGEWAMMYTQLPVSDPLNKPGLSTSQDGVAFSPSLGGAQQLVSMQGYPDWGAADVNGGNVLWYTPPAAHAENVSEGTNAGGQYDMYFVDFAARQHSVYHATATAGAVGTDTNTTAVPTFTYAGVALAEQGRIPNDIKHINGHYVLAMHSNSQQTYMSVADAKQAALAGAPPTTWPASSVLFEHTDASDMYIVSCGLIVDEASQVLRGALYGAGAVPTLDHNRVFATWLQRRAIFRSVDNATAFGVTSDDVQSYGADTVLLPANDLPIDARGRWYLYDADYVDEEQPGTLLAVSDEVAVAAGDVWRAQP